LFELKAMIENIPSRGKHGKIPIIAPKIKCSYRCLSRKSFGKNEHRIFSRVNIRTKPKIITTTPIKIKICSLKVLNKFNTVWPRKMINKQTMKLTTNLTNTNLKNPLMRSLKLEDVRTKYGITIGLQVKPHTPKQLPKPAKNNSNHSITSILIRYLLFLLFLA
jgi:hypothetical protein